jgi:hypothetical protein
LLALGGLFVCCLPLGLIGALQAGQATKKAKAEGRAPASLLGVAKILGWFSVVVSLGAYGFGAKSYFDNEAEVKALNDSVASERSVDTLSDKTACTLATAQLKRAGSVESVECKKPLETNGARAVLPGITVKTLDKTTTVSACFAKTKRWFVLETLETGNCSTRDMEANLKSLPEGDSPEALDRAEELYRKDELVFKRFVRLVERENALGDMLAAAREKSPETCPDFSKYTKDRTNEVVYVEALWMKKGEKEARDNNFRFMTKEILRDVLLDKGTEDAKTKALGEIEGAALFAVFIPTEKPTWPVPRVGGFIGGEYTGKLVLVDAKTKGALCQRPFRFESGESISVRRSRLGVTSQSKMEDQLAADFEEHFEDAATALLKDMSKNQLKLGMSWLD